MWSLPVRVHWRLAALAALFAIPVAAAGQAAITTPAFTPAVFVTGKNSLADRVSFPDYDDDIDISVMCRGHATVKGRLKDVLCSAADDPDLTFTNAVSRRIRSARLHPATVDAVPQEVDIQFSVRFRKAGDNEQIDVYLNNGNNTANLGVDYIAAQRYSPHVWPTRCSAWRDNEVLIEAATVDASGKAREANAMTSRTRMLEACRAALVSQLEAGRWIPAQHQGQFIDSVWFNPIMLNMQDIRF